MRRTILTRKRFLELGTGALALTVVQLGTGCPAEEAGACDTDPEVDIGANHGHVLEIPLEDVADGDRATYGIRGSADHDHTVTLTPEDLERLRDGREVIVSSSIDQGHSHSITLVCG